MPGGPKFTAQRDAIAVRQAEIEDQELEPGGGERAARRADRSCALHRITVAREDPEQEVSDGVVVVEHEDSRCGGSQSNADRGSATTPRDCIGL